MGAAAPGPPRATPTQASDLPAGWRSPARVGAIFGERAAAAGSPRVGNPNKKERKEIGTGLPARAARQTESALHPLFWWKGWGAWKGGGLPERVVIYDLTVDGV